MEPPSNSESAKIKLTRRELSLAALGLIGGFGLAKALERLTWSKATQSLVLNDIHSQINETVVKAIERPECLEDLIGIVRRADRADDSISIAGSRHAMGGQQFGRDSVLIDTRGMNKIIDFDPAKGLVEIEAGMEWPELFEQLLERQNQATDAWVVATKQTGADRLTVGGAVAANAHGRTLTEAPFVSHIESLLVVMADGAITRCSRSENPELFSLVVGGYGLFGIVHSVTLRLARRQVLRRVVKILDADKLMPSFESYIAEGYTLGDFQYATDESSPEFLRKGVFSCYIPVENDTKIPEKQEKVSMRAWQELVYLAHTDKARAFKLYSEFYLKTDGQLYWSDQSQLGAYDDSYHQKVDQRTGAKVKGSEMITEVNVPPARLDDFLTACAKLIKEAGASVIYGTIRLVEPDADCFLTYATKRLACVIFNIHMDHSEAGMDKARDVLRGLINLAIEREGTYYLTYHRWATKEQVLAAYPQFPQFMAKKLQYDPEERFQSEWYRHYREMFQA